MVKIWTNTSTLDGFDHNLNFTDVESEAEIALLGSKSIDIHRFPNLKAIFRAGIGRDNVPITKAEARGIIVRFPSSRTVEVIFEETANFTCYSILKMLYLNVGKINEWTKEPRINLKDKILLVIGKGNIGSRVFNKMKNFMIVKSFDIMDNNIEQLRPSVEIADCVSLHIPFIEENINFLDSQKLSWFKKDSVLINTARGKLVNEKALYEKLSKGHLRAFFDVYWEEPYHGILTEFYPDSFFMTPHVASTCTNFIQGCRDDLDSLIKEIKDA